MSDFTEFPIPYKTPDQAATQLQAAIKAVQYEPQSLSDTQKARARQNLAPFAPPAAGGKFNSPFTPPALPDGYSEVTHPSAIYIPGGMSGYDWWVAFTPFPGALREDPHICCSIDGVTLIQHPAASSMAILPAGWKASFDPIYNFCADTHIVLLSDGTVAVYFIAVRSSPYSTADVYRCISSDGISWSEPEMVVDGGDTPDYSRTTSPCVEYDPVDPNLMHMWTFGSTGLPGIGAGECGIYHRTSTDHGATWSEVEACTWPRLAAGGVTVEYFRPWHGDVKRAGTKWHMLVMSGPSSDAFPNRLFYLTSSNGTDWSGDVSQPVIPMMTDTLESWGTTANGYINEGHYRSAIWPVPGNPLSWRIWVSAWGSDNTQPIDNPAVGWRLALLENVVLDPLRKLLTVREFDQLRRRRTELSPLSAGWRLVVPSSNPMTLPASTGHTLHCTLPQNEAAWGIALPYFTGTGYAPSYLEGGIAEREYLDWRNRYFVETSFMYTGSEVEFYFLLGVHSAISNTSGFIGRCFGFAVKNHEVYAVANTTTDTDAINLAGRTAVCQLNPTTLDQRNSNHFVRMELTADGGANLLVNGWAYRVADGMPGSISPPVAANKPNAYGDSYRTQPAIYCKYHSSPAASRILYVNRFEVGVNRLEPITQTQINRKFYV